MDADRHRRPSSPRRGPEHPRCAPRSESVTRSGRRCYSNLAPSRRWACTCKSVRCARVRARARHARTTTDLFGGRGWRDRISQEDRSDTHAHTRTRRCQAHAACVRGRARLKVRACCASHAATISRVRAAARSPATMRACARARMELRSTDERRIGDGYGCPSLWSASCPSKRKNKGTWPVVLASISRLSNASVDTHWRIVHHFAVVAAARVGHPLTSNA
jgi:hypothetical protein